MTLPRWLELPAKTSAESRRIGKSARSWCDLQAITVFMMSRHSNARGVRKDESAGMPRDPLPQSGWKVLGIDLNSEHFRSAPRTCRSRSGKSRAGARCGSRREARRAPANGWSYYGLSQVHKARGDAATAAQAEAELAKTWIGDRAILQLGNL